jgi:hypothetical protein
VVREASTAAAARRGRATAVGSEVIVTGFSGEKNVAPKRCPGNKPALKE